MLLAMCFSVASMKSGEGAAAAAATDSLIGAAALEGDAPPAPEDAATAARRGEAFFADTSFLCRFCFGFRGESDLEVLEFKRMQAQQHVLTASGTAEDGAEETDTTSVSCSSFLGTCTVGHSIGFKVLPRGVHMFRLH